MSRAITRRTLLKGAGAALALPALDIMAMPDERPVRMAYVFFPNGVNAPNWLMRGEGPLADFPPALAAMEPHKKDILVLSGLAHRNGDALGDGPGDHARSAAVFLTGAHPRKTEGRDIQAGVSVDQVAARKVGERTRLPSLEMSCDRGSNVGNCDSGYSCAYSNNISWRGPAAPSGKLIIPREIFQRLFGEEEQLTDEERARRAADAASVLDLVKEDADRLRRALGRADQEKLDGYLESVRAVERRIEQAAKERRQLPKLDLPQGVPGDYREHMRLMTDLIALAFQTDTTRILTFMMGNEGSDRTYPWIGVRDGHHSLSHHGGDQGKVDKIRAIDKWFVEQFAALVAKLKAIPDGEGTLLDQSMVVFGCAISDGNAHNHENLPVILAGRGGGTIAPGRQVRYARGTPLCNLFLSMLDRMGVRETRFGDSTERLGKLE